MTRFESASASIGISILLSELILQINETNFNVIKEMLAKGYIEDNNDYYNEEYQEIIHCDKFQGNYTDVKEYLINEFKDNDSDAYNEFIYDKALLIPIKEILANSRLGYLRDGTNCISRPIDFDLSLDIEKYKDIKNIKIVFILRQDSG
jgi:hypothetical protein